MEISLPTVLGMLLLPAVTFALAYSTIVTHLSRGLISHYTKADVRKRFSAALVDGLVVMTLSLGYWTGNSPLYLAIGAAYLLLRDAIGGRSIGKLLAGLVVISLETGRVSSFAGSAKRNLLLLLPGANVVAIFLEARTIVADPQGQRLGDKLAQTQVVEGAGAKELVKSFHEWLMSFGSGLGRGRGRNHGPAVRRSLAAFSIAPRSSSNTCSGAICFRHWLSVHEEVRWLAAEKHGLHDRFE